MAKNSPFYIDLGNGLFTMIGLPAIPIWKTTNRPKKAKPGTFGFNSQTNQLEYWDGTAWFAANLSEA